MLGIHIAEMEVGNMGAPVKGWSAGCSCGWSHPITRDPHKLENAIIVHCRETGHFRSCPCNREFQATLKDLGN